jgi:predicted HTH domain antitoxin
MKRSLVATRLSPEELEELEDLARLEGVDRSALLRRIIREGLERTKWRIAVARYREGQWSLRRAAEAAGLPYRAMLDRLAADGEILSYSEQELEEDLHRITRT